VEASGKDQSLCYVALEDLSRGRLGILWALFSLLSRTGTWGKVRRLFCEYLLVQYHALQRTDR